MNVSFLQAPDGHFNAPEVLVKLAPTLRETDLVELTRSLVEDCKQDSEEGKGATFTVRIPAQLPVVVV